jgi:hypothetical protein
MIVVPAFSLSIFLSAFLLFIIQPLLAKKLLPWFGGSPAVWLSIVLFFQSALLIGYLYAFALTKIKQQSTQVIIHCTLLLCSLIFIPIVPFEKALALTLWPPVGVMAVLAGTLFLPGIIICASSPLFQYWYCQCFQTDFPYRYYALSNFGSLLGLLAFPFLLEPFLGLNIQLYLWSGLYIVYLVSSVACAIFVLRSTRTKAQELTNITENSTLSKVSLLKWIVLTMLSCALLLTTSQVTLQDIASFPLLWIIPLSLYLISYIVTFSYPKLYYRPLWVSIFTVLCLTIFYYPSHHKLLLATQLCIYSLLLFSGCMICHGELIRLKPNKAWLTTYYLAIAVGGVLGGIFVNVIAPFVFNQWWDFYLTLIGIFLCAAYFYFTTVQLQSVIFRRTLSGVWALSFAALNILLYYHMDNLHQDVIYKHRNFFGVFEITERNPFYPEYHYRTLNNGNILHGKQYMEPSRRNLATSYYSPQSGVGLALNYARHLKKAQPHYQGLRIGVIGLGAGTIAALSTPGDFLRFYEIDADIASIAKDYFYYLHDAKAATQVVIADGRVALNNSLKAYGSENYDVLAIDAFTGDAIPLHLLTIEAFKIYLAHLSENGILAVHISSRYIDLYPPLQSLASQLHLFTYTTHNDEDYPHGIFSSQWILMSRQPDIGAYLYQERALLFPDKRISPIWTDDFNYLLSVIRW